MNDLQKKQLEKQQELEAFKEKCNKMKKEELEQLEQEYINKADEIDKMCATKMFNLPEENYEAVAKGIRMFLNRETVQLEYSLGMKILYDFWNPEVRPKEINYPTLDSTLRILGEKQFTGYEEWCAIIDINNYVAPMREEYFNILNDVYDIAAHHNVIMDELKTRNPISNVNK